MGLQFIEGRIICSIDMESKNWHTFENGVTIRRERQYNELNQRITQPVNATVISAEYIPSGSQILIHHNAAHDVNRIFDYKNLSGIVEADSVKYYSIPESECFAWRDESGELKPMKGFQFALRVFEPYEGIIAGIEPELIKNVLYLTTGNLKGNICHVLKASDYEIIFQGLDGREARVIRIRHSDEEELEREEVVAISHSLTEKLNEGKLLIGLTTTDAKPINTTNDKATNHARESHLTSGT